MSKVFISYSSQDSSIAQKIYSRLENNGIKPFMSELSIEGGQLGDEEIFFHLKKAELVFFLATPNSIHSQAVNQELGASLGQNKTIVPLLVDVQPTELPAWVKKYQAIDLRKAPERLDALVSKVSQKAKENSGAIMTLAIALVAGILLLKK